MQGHGRLGAALSSFAVAGKKLSTRNSSQSHCEGLILRAAASEAAEWMVPTTEGCDKFMAI
jgi:hypothetical protein